MLILTLNRVGTSISFNSDEGILPTQIIEVDYDALPFRCRLSWKHKVKDYREGLRLPKGPKRSSLASQKQPQEKNKGKVVDHEGFQQIRNKRSIRRNIFEETEERNKNDLWEEFKK